MYIRTVSRKNKDGSVVRYIQLAHNVWDPVKKHATAKLIYSFGREDQLDRAELERLVDSICRYLSPEQALKSKATIKSAADFVFKTSKELGGPWVLNCLWDMLGIDKVIKEILQGRKYDIDVERLLFAMVANRAINPKSKLAVVDWAKDKVVIPGIKEFNVQQLYRSMDFLLEAQGDIEERVYSSVAHLLNLEVDIIFFDTTSTYFEVEPSELDQGDIRKFGLSKDKRSDRVQITIGLAVTKEGIPVRSWVWPGNSSDQNVLKEVKDDLVSWKLGRIITVTDRGFSSEENHKYLQRAGGHFIMGEKMRSGSEDTDAAMGKKGRFTEICSNLMVKEVYIGEGERRKRYVLVYNPDQAKRDQKKREEIIKDLEEELKNLKQLPDRKHTKAVCALRSHKLYGPYLRQLKDGRLKIDKTKVRNAARYDGKYLIHTSDDTLSMEDIALGYKQLIDVESAFRSIKGDLKIRPIFHRLEERIRGHVLICWLALLLVRVAENKCNDTWANIRDELGNIHVGEFISNSGGFEMRTEITPKQRKYLKSLRVPEPPLFTEIDPKHRNMPKLLPDA